MSQAIIVKSGNVTKSYVDSGLNLKVDKVEGKNLSTNDYTSDDKAKVNNISMYGNGNTSVGIESQALYGNSTALGNSSGAQASNSTAIGSGSVALNNSVAVGRLSQVNHIYGTAVGSSSSVTHPYGVAIGCNSLSAGYYAVALGYESVANSINVVSVGSGDSTKQSYTRRIINVTDPENNQDAATKNYVDNAIVTAINRITNADEVSY